MNQKIITLALGSFMLVHGHAFADAAPLWSPDKSLYIHSFYFNPPAKSENDKSSERERLVVYSADEKVVATAHIWLIEPDGTLRAGIRACESLGWLDNRRIFCKGTINPYRSIELIFDARTGRELQETIDPPLSP